MKIDQYLLAEAPVFSGSLRQPPTNCQHKLNINNGLALLAVGGRLLAENVCQHSKNPVMTGAVARFFSTAETPIYKYIGRHFSCLPNYILDMFCASNFGGVNDE